MLRLFNTTWKRPDWTLDYSQIKFGARIQLLSLLQHLEDDQRLPKPIISHLSTSRLMMRIPMMRANQNLQNNKDKEKTSSTPSQRTSHESTPLAPSMPPNPTSIRNTPTAIIKDPVGPTRNSHPTSPQIWVVDCSRADFEAGYNIVDFATRICHINDSRQILLDRREVERLFHNQVQDAYSFRDPMVDRLLNQVCSQLLSLPSQESVTSR